MVDDTGERSEDSSESTLDRLRASGDLFPAEGKMDGIGDPIPLLLGQEPPSRVLARLRGNQR